MASGVLYQAGIDVASMYTIAAVGNTGVAAAVGGNTAAAGAAVRADTAAADVAT
jgi:hypothetical protein